jgi:hypothetical protein
MEGNLSDCLMFFVRCFEQYSSYLSLTIHLVMEKIDYQIDRKHNRRIHEPVLIKRVFLDGFALRLFIIFFLLTLFSNLQLRCEEIYSVKSGPWSDPSSWQGSVIPGAHSQVTIHPTHAVTLDVADVVVNSLIIQAGAELILNHNLSISKQDMESTANLIVDTMAILDANNNVVEGSGGFILEDGGTLITSHPEGISYELNTGCIRTNERNFGSAAIYHYNGNGNQHSGNALPMVDAPKVIIVKLAHDGLEFRINTSAAIEIAAGGRLEIRSGIVIESNSPSEGRHIEGAGDLIMTGGIYRIESVFEDGSSLRIPRLSGSFSDGDVGHLLGTIVLAGNDKYQYLRSGRDYNNIQFTGEGQKVIINSTPDIYGTVFIENGIVNARHYQFGKDVTNLTMTSGHLITSSTGTSPDMGGTYTLTGGTIEFANTSDGLQTIRGADREYFNINVTGTSVANSNGQIRIKAGGTFTIKGGGIFRFNAHFISGEGSFVMEPNSTLFIGSPYGIKLNGESTTDGNIRVSGNREFSPLAAYGFIGSDNQVTGNALPSTVNKLILDKEGSSTVVLSKDVTVSAELELNQGILVTGQNELYLSNPQASSLVAGSGNTNFKNSFIRGSLKRQVAFTDVNYLFPIGLTSTPQTASINFNQGKLSGSEPMTLQTQFLLPPDDYYGDLPKEMDEVMVNNLYDAGFWQITQDNITAAEYSLSLYTGGSVAIPVPDGIRIVKREQGEPIWEMAGDTPSYSGADPDYTFTQHNIDGFSEFAIGGDVHDNPLPVEWLSMDVSQVDGVVNINWQTATETNNHYFSIQRSPDGFNFQQLGQVPGAGNSSIINRYSFADYDPLPGIGYYRIMQTDFDGTNSHSKVLAWQYQTTKEPTILLHNQQIHFQITESISTSWNYQVYSITGTLLSSGEIPSGTSRIVDAAAMRNQLLVIVLSNGNVMVRKKMVVK